MVGRGPSGVEAVNRWPAVAALRTGACVPYEGVPELAVGSGSRGGEGTKGTAPPCCSRNRLRVALAMVH